MHFTRAESSSMIIYLHTQFHMYIFNGSIIITIKPNATHYMAAMSIYNYPETALNKCCIFFKYSSIH
jgi:hypothetical protein